MLVLMENTRNKGGRPRKDSTEKKLHRVQVAMSDAEQAAARRLAAMLGTSVSAAIASYAVPVALRAKTVDLLAERILHELTAAAKSTAELVILSQLAAIARDADVERFDMDKFAAHQNLIVVHFVGSGTAHRILQTPWKRLYDEALLHYSRTYAETAVAAVEDLSKDELLQVPYSVEKTVVLFSFANESRIGTLYRYHQPIEWSGMLNDRSDESYAQ